MRMYDIIEKKRDGMTLSKEEIDFFINGYTDGTVPDYQAAALCMAIYVNGMDMQETSLLTAAMAHSGDMVDLTSIDGVKVDKHSTGGVGDKTTLVIAPVLACLGIKVAKMSGRGLGHTGGTLDKIESVPGASVAISEDNFLNQVREIGLAVIGQTSNLAPADKKLYALRDVTATVSSIPLIASSIMCKKLASGADSILLDVKTGNGAFMKTFDEAVELAKTMVEIGERNGKNTAAIITDMGTPLGQNVGNSLEVAEVVKTLNGNGPEDLTSVCKELCKKLLLISGYADENGCANAVETAFESKKAHTKLCDMFEMQGGDRAYIENPEKFKTADYSIEIKSEKDGYICAMDTENIGKTAVILGAGREKKEDAIDFAAGIAILKKTGDAVKKGDVLAVLYTEKEETLKSAQQNYVDSLIIEQCAPVQQKLIFGYVDKNGVTVY